MKKPTMLTLAALAVLALGTTPATAQTDWDPRHGPEPGMGYKFGRGVVNVLTFWTEVPRNVALEWQRTDPASGFFLGVGKGVGYSYARLMGGVYDIVTFPFPVPMGFAPVMHPEFSAHNEYREVATGRELLQPLHVTYSHEDVMADRAVRPTRHWP
jgi:putative exosortase-associated protein (TIGR04073 family)